MNIIDIIFSIIIYPGIIFILFFSLLYSGILRKLAARMQNRIGPPVWQPVFDLIKLLGKENIKPEQAKVGFTMWPIVTVASVLMAGLLTPIAGEAALSTSGGLILLLYFFVFSSVAVLLSGLASANPFGVVGAIRELVQLVSYEFPFIVSLLVPAFFFRTLSPMIVNSGQLATGPLIFLYPLAGIAFFTSALAKCELPPFHIPNAHQEIVSGYSAEYTGVRLAFIELAYIIEMFVLLSLGIAFYLGGSFGFWDFLLKSMLLLILFTTIRVVFARLRIDQALKFYWLLGLLALIDLLRALVFA
jgi:NADH-quinone oxidoreductase subunit H